MSENEESQQLALHTKYRPSSLMRLIGHVHAVTRMKGMIADNEIPSAILITGPSSVGKTTMARALAEAINGKPVSQQQDYMELNAANQRGIDDVRELIRISEFRPINTRRIFVIDEAQQLATNAAAAQAFLKPLEEPRPGTLWILCSMDPSKFQTGVGKAMANRCVQFCLEPHDDADLLKQALRIAKGEGMSYVMDTERRLLRALVQNCNGEMRTLANLMQSVKQYYSGLDEKPKRLLSKDLSTVLSSTVSVDDKLAVNVMLGLYAGQYTLIHRSLLDISDGFSFIKKLLYLSDFMLSNAVLKGERHRKVWWNASNKELHTKLEAASKQEGAPKITLGVHAAINARLVRIAAQASQFQISAEQLLSSELYYLVKELHTK